MEHMLLTTTNTLEGKQVDQYLGIVTGEVIVGANVLKDFVAGLTDFFGGRSGVYERTFAEAREQALSEMAARAKQLGADAVIGVDLDYETIGAMLMVNASGTAVVLRK